MSKPKIGIILSGCGFLDGAEVHESVCTLLAVDELGGEKIITAPDVEQAHVVDHSTSEEASGDKRRVMTEAARIARGPLKNIAELKAADLDALLLPGGFGAAKNLSTFAFDGADMKVNSEVERLIKQMNDSSKPIGFICIAPVIGAKTLGHKKPLLTIGNDAGTAEAVEKLGAVHRDCPVDDCVVDKTNKIVSTPAYMLGPDIAQVNAGIRKLVEEVFKMI